MLSFLSSLLRRRPRKIAALQSTGAVFKPSIFQKATEQIDSSGSSPGLPASPAEPLGSGSPWNHIPQLQPPRTGGNAAPPRQSFCAAPTTYSGCDVRIWVGPYWSTQKAYHGRVSSESYRRSQAQELPGVSHLSWNYRRAFGFAGTLRVALVCDAGLKTLLDGHRRFDLHLLADGGFGSRMQAAIIGARVVSYRSACSIGDLVLEHIIDFEAKQILPWKPEAPST